jgi:hypothetical protein
LLLLLLLTKVARLSKVLADELVLLDLEPSILDTSTHVITTIQDNLPKLCRTKLCNCPATKTACFLIYDIQTLLTTAAAAGTGDAVAI